MVPTLAAFAADAAKPKPNTLTPKEIADGWILLFDGESTFGWKSVDDSEWTIADGMLAPQGDKAAALLSTTAFSEYTIEIQYQVTKESDAKLLCNQPAAEKKASPETKVDLVSYGPGWTTAKATIRDGTLATLDYSGATGGSGTTFPRAIGNDAKPLSTSGFVCLSGRHFAIRNFKIKPLGDRPLPIFNGKDLDNWKVFQGTTPGKAKVQSEFTVTKEGWISLKNGPGDLQSKEAWADFVLQIECKSNGKALNSGVFFRCRPDEYQMGYEAQIHNGFTEKPEKKYKIEEYDPKTNELKATKEVAYTATDYGTGAIYRRIPARLEAAKDNEWFTMTVVAQGRHIATWVNGIQVVDWTDNRPLKDNARNGCRLERGPISLQGHDATTDLNFRNIRIAELPPLVDKK
jgi:hypothetical protein